MSRKNHIKIDGMLIRTDKQFRHLKNSQKEKISNWLYDEYKIAYPVMHTPSNPQKYLNKNFYGEYSYSGTPFLDSRCSADSTNLIIYGHHMNNGTMFADLCNYTEGSALHC